MTANSTRALIVFIGVAIGTGIGFMGARQDSEPIGQPAREDLAIPVPGPAAQDNPSSAGAGAVPVALPSEQIVRFQAWRKAEAENLNRPGGSPAGHEEVLREKSKQLTTPEWDEVVRTILDLDAPANERVLSAYLLGLGGFGNLAGVEAVFDQRLPEGPQKPHSIEETVAMREKSLRTVIIDQLIAEAKADPSKRELLAQTIRRIDDPYLRDLANRRLREEGLL